MRIWSFLRLVMFLSVYASVAFAQDQAAVGLLDLSLEQLMKVQFYTASKHSQDVSETPASVTIITRADIHTYGYRTLAEVLEGVRGFWVNSDRNYSYVGVRGFALSGDFNTRVLFLLDGHRLNDNIGSRALIGTEFPVDMDLVERIEIVRGPGSSLYGTNAMFGVVNVVTRVPAEISTIESSVSAATYLTGKARLTIGLPHVLDGVVLSASTYQSGGSHNLYFPEFDTPATNYGVAQAVDGDRANSLFGLVRWKHFQFEGLICSRRKVVPIPVFPDGFDSRGNNTTDTSGFTELSYRRDLSKGLQVTSRWFYDSLRYRGSFVYQVVPFQVEAYDAKGGDAVGTETNISRPIGKRNTITAGAEFRYDLNEEQKVGYSFLRAPAFSSNQNANIAAFYAQDELRVTSQLLVNAGLRFDHYSTFGSTVSPRIAAVFHVDNKTAIKYSYGQGFRAPNAYEMFYSNGVTQEENPRLKPERIASSELGLERVLTPTFHIVFEAFNSDLSKMLEREVDPATSLAHFVNVSSSNGRGLEFELDAQHKRLRSELSYTVQRSTDGRSRAALADSPQHIAKLNMHIPLPLAFQAALGLQYLSPQRTPPPASVKVPDSLSTNLTMSTRKPILGFSLSASCYNLFDRRSYDPTATSLPRILQDGRGFRVQVARGWSRS